MSKHLCMFSLELTNFFANANIGNVIVGSLLREPTPHGRNVADTDTLKRTNIPLNKSLSFTQENDPLYRIVDTYTLIALFNIHAHYTQMRHPGGFRLSASKEMRQYLRQTIIDTIDRDVNNVLKYYKDDPFVVKSVKDTQKRLINNI